MPTVLNANNSTLLVDGDAVEGVQSIAFRVVTERENIRAIGSDERVAVSFGLRTVQGEVVVRSISASLDTKLATRAGFNMVASLKNGPGAKEAQRSYAFDDCYVEDKSLGISAGGTAETTYVFTATRVREE
jgi:hypothetical protein